MRDSMDFDTTPIDEQCEQCPYSDGGIKARKEAAAFIGQLKRQFGEPPMGVRFKIKSNMHDFGSYVSLEAIFDDENNEAVDYVYNIEGNLPERWDDEARKELGLV